MWPTLYVTDEESDSGAEDNRDAAAAADQHAFAPRNHTHKHHSNNDEHAQHEREGSESSSRERRTMEEVLLHKYGVSLSHLEAAGCAAPPPQLLRLRMTEAEWDKHLRRAGVDRYLNLHTHTNTAPSSTTGVSSSASRCRTLASTTPASYNDHGQNGQHGSHHAPPPHSARTAMTPRSTSSADATSACAGDDQPLPHG